MAYYLSAVLCSIIGATSAYEFVAAGAVCENGGEKARAEGAELRDKREHGNLAGADALRLQEYCNQRHCQAVRCDPKQQRGRPGSSRKLHEWHKWLV